MNVLKAISKYPHLNAYDAIEMSEPRVQMLGIRITEEDHRLLKKVAKEKKIKVTQMAYLLLHKKIFEYCLNYAAEVAAPTQSNSTREIVSEQMRWKILERDDFRCQKCGSRKYLHVDHIHPRSKGGKAIEKNLQTLCRKCNT